MRPITGTMTSSRITEDRDKWRKYVHGVANPWIEDGYKNRTEQTSSKKTGSAGRIATPPDEVRTTAVGNMHRKFGEVRMCNFGNILRSSDHNTPLRILEVCFQCPYIF